MGTMQDAKPMTWGEKLTRQNRGLKEKIGVLKTEAATLQRELRNTWQLMEALPGEVILVEKGHIVFANEAACDVFGYEKQDLLQMSLTDLVHPDSKGFLKDLSERNYPGDRIHDPYEVTFLKKNGKRLSCGVGVRAIRRNRKKAFLVNILEIEQIKENQRRASASVNAQTMKRVLAMFDKQMEAFMLVLEEPAGGAGKSQTGGRMPEIFSERLAHLRKICSPMGREFRFIGRSEYDPSEMGLFDLQEVIRDAEGISRNRVFGPPGKEEVEVGLKKYLRTVSPLWGCRDEMREAFVSIIQNAMEATDSFGEIHVTSEEDSGFAFVYVQDSGAGIRKDVADNLYEPFFTTKKFPHRGLGLSVAYAVIERHGGKIDFISREGQGTTVAVRLPLAEKGVTNKAGVRKNWIKDRSILLISSENRLTDLLRLLFSDRGGLVTVVSGEKDGVRELRKDRYDLLIMHYDASRDSMESMIRRIKKLWPDLAMILIGVDKQTREKPFWEQLGVDFMEGRPLDMDLFFLLLSEVFQRKEVR